MTLSLTPSLAIAVAVGGALGALLRYGAQLLWPARGSRIPRAVLLVNVVGSAIGGVFLALSTAGSTAGSTPLVSSAVAIVVTTGFCGGLTTFSTFSVETVELATSGAWRAAVALPARVILADTLLERDADADACRVELAVCVALPARVPVAVKLSAAVVWPASGASLSRHS